MQEVVQRVVDLESELGLDVLVEEAEGEDGEGGVAKIVHWDECLVQGCLQAKNMEKEKIKDCWHHLLLVM